MKTNVIGWLLLLKLMPLLTALALIAVPIAVKTSMCLVAEAQTVTTLPTLLGVCPDPSSVRSTISAINVAILMAIIAMVVFVLLFNLFGTISRVAGAVGEFFMTRIGVVFELVLIWILFLWGLESSIGTAQGSGCACINWQNLFGNGPLFFRVVNILMAMIGLGTPQTSGCQAT